MGSVFNYNLDRMQEGLSGVTVSVEEARKSRKEFKEVRMVKKYTLEQMKERFGVGYSAGIRDIWEHFKLTPYREDLKDSPEAVKDYLVQLARDRLESEYKRVDKIVEDCEAQWKWYHKVMLKPQKIRRIADERKREVQEDFEREVKEVENYPVKYIQEAEYTQYVPDLSEGDTVYVASIASHGTPLPVGLYPVKIHTVDWYVSFAGTVIEYRAEGVTDDGVEVMLRAVNDGKYVTTNWWGQTVHFDKESAVNHLKKYLGDQMTKLENTLNDIK